jgi:iron complex transport system substrate-binding protein
MHKFIIIRTFVLCVSAFLYPMLELTEYQRERLELIEHKLKFVTDKPLVACIEGPDNVRSAGIYMDELVTLAGGRPLVFTDGKEVYDTVVEQDPDIIIVMPVAGSPVEAMGAMPQLIQQPGISSIKAVKTNRLYITDADFFISEATDIVDKAELLAEIIYPKQFIFGYEGEGWIKFGV